MRGEHGRDVKRRLAQHLGTKRCEGCDWDPCSFFGEDGWSMLDQHHVNPKSKGGGGVLENRVLLCPRCHRIADRLWKGTWEAWGKSSRVPQNRAACLAEIRRINAELSSLSSNGVDETETDKVLLSRRCPNSRQMKQCNRGKTVDEKLAY
jgi:predicted restriction endonuclease